MVEEESVLDLFTLLTKQFVPKKKVFLKQPSLSRSETEKLMKKTLFDALFGSLECPMKNTHKKPAVPKQRQSVKMELLSLLFEMRALKKYDEASKLEVLSDQYFSLCESKDVELWENMLKFLLLLSGLKGSCEQASPGSFEGKMANAGPRNYGDVNHQSSEANHYYMHFPAEVFTDFGHQMEPNQSPSLSTVNSDLFSMIPGTGLPFVFKNDVDKTSYSQQNRRSLFGALVNKKASCESVDVKLNIPGFSDDVHGKGFKRPSLCAFLDNGYESLSSSQQSSISPVHELSIDSGRGSLKSLDIWDMALKSKSKKILKWESNVGSLSENGKEYITEVGPDGLNYLHSHDLQTICLYDIQGKIPIKSKMSSMEKIVGDIINMLIGIPSTSFVYDSCSQEFYMKLGLCLKGISREALQKTCKSLIQCGTAYMRLENFSAPDKSNGEQSGLVFQAFADGIRKYLHHYKACVLTMSAKSNTPMELTVKFRNLISQINFLAALCGCNSPDVQFPLRGVGLLSYLYEECLDASNSLHYPVLLTLLHSAAKPFLIFIQEWVFHGVNRDIYMEFIVEVQDRFLEMRDEMFWTHSYKLMQNNDKESIPLFLKDLTKEIFVCGKSLNFLQLIDPQHFLFGINVDIPTVQITFSENEMRRIKVLCDVYTGKLQEMARQFTVSKEEQLIKETVAKMEVMAQARHNAALKMERIVNQEKEKQIQVQNKKRKLLLELQQQMEAKVQQQKESKQQELREDRVIQEERAGRQESERLKLQVKEEMLDYYSKLSEAATIREQRANWQIERSKLHMKRINFLEIQGELLQAELQSNPIPVKQQLSAMSDMGSDDNGIDHDNDDVDRMRERFLSSDSNLPSWVKRDEEPNSDTIVISDVERKNPSDSSIELLMYRSENLENPVHLRTHLKPTAQHPSDTSVDGLLKMTSDNAITSSRQSEQMTVKELAEAKELHEVQTGKKLTKVIQHPSLSSIEELMYPDEKNESPLEETQKGLEGHIVELSENTGASRTRTKLSNAPLANISESVDESTSTVQGLADRKDTVNAVQSTVFEDFSNDEQIVEKPMLEDQPTDEPPEETENLSNTFSFVIESEIMSYEDNFDLLWQPPRVDTMSRYCLTMIGASLLPSELDDDIQAHLYGSLPVLLRRSVVAPLNAQISLVNQNILNLYFVELRINKHFEVLRSFMLMQDGEFGESLSSQLFEKLSCNPTVHELLNPIFLNSVLQRAIQQSLEGENEYSSNINFLLTSVPTSFSQSAPDVLDGLELSYKVSWPVNVVVTDRCLSLYSKVFSFMMLLKRVMWSLQDIWYRLKRDKVITRVESAEEYHSLQLYRREMQHFVKVIQEYISNQVIHVSWQEFQDDLDTKVKNLDDLRHSHLNYLLNCQARCLLDEKTKKVAFVIRNIFKLILTFRVQLHACEWQRSVEGVIQHPNYQDMCDTFKTFKEHSLFLFNVVRKLAIRGYQPHLQDLIVRLNFNGYYK